MSRTLIVAIFVVEASVASADGMPEFPPGVTLASEFPGSKKFPIGVEIHAVEVDWTNPRLKARVVVGIEEDRGAAAAWNIIAPNSLKIQLAQPIETENEWVLDADVEIPDDKFASPRDSKRKEVELNPEPASTASLGSPEIRDQVRVGGILPWFFAGPTADTDADPVSPLIEGSSRVGVRWLGHPPDWKERTPTFEFLDPLLLSFLDPLTGHCHFLLVVNRSNRRLPASHLTDWITASWPQRVWIAVHCLGPQTRVGMGAWRLGDSGTERAPQIRGVERLGAALILEKQTSEDAEDWGRIERSTITASSSIPNHPPESVVSGLLWPVLLRPSAWVASQSSEGPKENSWIEIALDRARPIESIRLIQASAVGWSEHFNPGEIELRWRDVQSGRLSEPLEILSADRPYNTIRFSAPKLMDRVRIEIKNPSKGNANSISARLAGVQFIGPVGEGQP